MIKKGLTAGLALLLVGIFLNWLFSQVFPGLTVEYQNTAIFRPWQDPLMMAFFAYPFILGVVASYLWDKINHQLKGDEFKRAFEFAKFYFIIATIPGMFVSYTSMQLSLLMILIWTLTGFIEAYVAGYIFAKMK